MSNTYTVELAQEPIELYKLLKLANLVSGGGEAKMAITQGYVLVNDEVEYQKRKKIYQGDLVAFNGDFLEIEVNEALADAIPEQSAEHSPTPKEKKQPKKKQGQKKAPASKGKKQAQENKQKNKKKPKAKSDNTPEITGKRKPISF